MTYIYLFPLVSEFGEDKDIAASLRDEKIKPSVSRSERVIIDFNEVTLVTQSFVHALISDTLRVNGEQALDIIEFKNCVDVVRGIVSTVVQYSLDTLVDLDSLAEELERADIEKQQSFQFMRTAKELGVDLDEAKLAETLRRVVKHDPEKKKPADE